MRHPMLIAVVSVACSTTMAAAQSPTGLTYPIVDTAQTQCFDDDGTLWSCPKKGEAYFGQDGNYTINPPKYKDNGDGTVTDLVTGLMWEKGFVNDVPWAQGPTYARKARTGGYTDWRVPSTKELYSLILFSGNQGRGNPSSKTPPGDAKPFMDTRAFDFEYPNRNRYIDAQYLTTTDYRGIAMGQRAWFGVNFADGRIKGYPQPQMPHRQGWYLKLVRGNTQYGKNDFRDNGDGTVIDNATGLQWLQNDSGGDAFKPSVAQNHYKDGRMDWPEALQFCENLQFAGKKDWRLPNAKTLQSIVDYTRSPQSTGTAAIDPIFTVTPITDERGQTNFPGFWASTTLRAGSVDGVVVYFGEALGAPQMGGSNMQGGPQGMMGQGGMQQGHGFGPPSGMRQGMMGQGGMQQGQGFGPPPGMRQGMMGQGGMQQGQGFGPPPGMRQGMMGQGGMQQGQGFGPPPGMRQGMMGQGGMQQGQGFGQRPGMQQPGGRQGSQQGPGMTQQSSLPASSIMDVHGAGAQRSDPKVGDPSRYPLWGHGPQGDVRRVYNFVRCVRTSN